MTDLTINKKIEKKLEKIDKLINTNQIHLFNNKYKLILSAKNNKELKKLVNTLDPPKKDVKIFFVRVIKSYDENSHPLSIQCTSSTLTPNLHVYIEDNDTGTTIYYTNEDLLKYGFKMSHIQRIIKVVKYNLITFGPYSIPITKILKIFDKQKK